MKKSEKRAGVTGNLDFELPDWTGMDDASPRISAEAAFELCENYPALAASKARARRRNDRPPKCVVEFIL